MVIVSIRSFRDLRSQGIWLWKTCRNPVDKLLAVTPVVGGVTAVVLLDLTNCGQRYHRTLLQLFTLLTFTVLDRFFLSASENQHITRKLEIGIRRLESVLSFFCLEFRALGIIRWVPVTWPSIIGWTGGHVPPTFWSRRDVMCFVPPYFLGEQIPINM